MSEEKLLSLISHSTLVVDDTLYKYLTHSKYNCNDLSGYYSTDYMNTLNECIEYRSDKTIIESFIKKLKINKAKFYRHAKYESYIYAITSEAFNIYHIYIKDRIFYCDHTNHILKDQFPEPYVYIGIRTTSKNVIAYRKTDITYAYGMTINEVYDKLKLTCHINDNMIIHRISLNHLGGSDWYFGTGRDNDYKLYYDIHDELKKLSPLEYYHYCMRLIESEVMEIDPKDDSIISTTWQMESFAVDKCREDFENPITYNEMMNCRSPIFWGYYTPYDTETIDYPRRPK